MEKGRLCYLGAAMVILFLGIRWFTQPETPQGSTGSGMLPAPNTSASERLLLRGDAETADSDAVRIEPQTTPVLSAEQQLARDKNIDREHLRKIHTALFAYKEAHGHFPEYLSQLAPKFLDPAALESP